VRYLQLRDKVQDDDKDRSTPATLERLRAFGSLDESDFGVLADGYSLLRSVDHSARLLSGRSGRLPSPDRPAFRDIARRLGYQSAADLMKELSVRMTGIRQAFDKIMNFEATRDGE
jgi:glutamine synthetase adenylyltransferase